MTSESLNCPNCGAAVASDAVQCEFCQARLKTMACPKCFEPMFIGSQFCDHCGAKAVRADVSATSDLGDCPRCRVPLELLQVGANSFGECGKCDGLWAGVDAFETICADREEQSTVLGYIRGRETTSVSESNVSYVPCPKCKQLMNRSNFARASGIIIDTCKGHGVWFDPDELPKVIEFIQKGGMEISRERERADIETERERLRDGVRSPAMFDSGFDEDDERHSSGISGLIQKLFD